MDVFESGIFYGEKLHPSQSQHLNADAAAVVAAPVTSGRALGKATTGSNESVGKTTPYGGVATGKSGVDLMNTGAAQAATAATQPQVADSATPTPPPPAGPFLGTFQFPQQQYYPECDMQQGGVSKKTLLYVAVGIAAVGLFIYYKKHNA